MKKLLMILFCVCLLSVQGLAVDRAQYESIDENGNTYFDENAYQAAVAAEKIAVAGVDLDVDTFWSVDWLGIPYYDQDAFEVAYTDAVEQLAAQQSAEDGGTSHGSATSTAPSQTGVVSASDDRYPVGSFVDEAGNVFSAEGKLLLAGDPATVSTDVVGPAADPLLDGEVPSSDGTDTTAATVYAVSDLRLGDDPAGSVVSGLKALIISIFGEYEPVMTTGMVVDTIDGVTTTTLVDTVAAGAAGVDYEWLAGVFLFGILLFCLMKLLGGILK